MLEQFNYINTFIFDIDGVLTDGSLLVMPDGLMARRMNIKDGYALQLAIKKGYQVIVISGGNSPEVKERLKKLGIESVHMQVTDKLSLLKSILSETQIAQDSCLFMGDDIPDLECMKWVGLPVCPADAVSEIKEISLYISAVSGGMGCARDVIEKVMKLRGDWNEDFTVRAQ
ncbi:MAG: 3-deoxy-D-manno-octulosonate 8-phosphate phosphatase [Chitinophaga sp.]|jgi:3-deoxy-D-manno-octulosonate 8-phosphate phosphatase (KDO 8-P phosphatase)|nr:3-deoxy-D-manno-octulosonate 8-phosphate phosphatase [Chitinophaga sp.]PJE47758.1 MAG: 3-deoxy-D-manno-octulosonate 8-phosphate phosphatase [Sediminibacterium sp.] [Sediminibacterium sp. FEMGT703S]